METFENSLNVKIAREMIKDIKERTSFAYLEKVESKCYEILTNQKAKAVKEKGYYNVIVYGEDDVILDIYSTESETEESLAKVLDYLIFKEPTFKTGKMIVVTSDDEIKTADYSGLESMQQNVNGYIEHFYSTNLFNIDIDCFCNEEFWYAECNEVKKINAISSIMSGRVIMGNVIFIAFEIEHGNTRGFNDKETKKMIEYLQEMVKVFKRLKKDNVCILEHLHKTYDRK